MSCFHFSQIRISKLRQRLNGNLKLANCETCQEESPWLCLSCYAQNCGRYQNQHALQHAKSKNHPMCVSISSLDVWCYTCDSSLQELAEAFESEEKKERALGVMEDVKDLIIKKKKKQAKELTEERQPKPSKKPSKKELSQPLETPPVKQASYLTGLSNLGNTCFFNSAMQCLNATQLLTNYYCGKFENPKKGGINTAFSSVLKSMRSESRTVNPGKLHSSVMGKFPQFRGYGQQDSHELLRCLLDALHTEIENLNKKQGLKEKTIIEEVFGGKLLSTVKCLRCSNVSRKVDPILDLSLGIPSKRKQHFTEDAVEFNPIPREELPEECKDQELLEPSIACFENPHSLKGCLEEFTSEEYLKDKHNLYDCEKCSEKAPAARRFLIYDPPEVLVVHLKRFSAKGFGFQKIGHHIDFEPELDISRFMVKKDDRGLYELFGVVVHSGSMMGGHYVAHVKHEDSWHFCSDSRVKTSSQGVALKAEAYVLFYKRINL